ncbi:aldo/keto reductase [Bacillus sp. HMF5848]|uniref:aldo/keto reductase n=1 Tax=Bacillus sp. HMF5848 TaxID=2495421 RepID=UPI000F79F8A8|nr:aldo/keto reductase [Bacillus sp. HMF5848]RSK27215.1 aldo/keto reductase [Bacillus sp. HMF5848]
MKQIALEKHDITSSRLVYGCMGLGGSWSKDPITNEDIIQAEKAIDAALEIGISMFDHADIYKMGKSEMVFSNVLKNNPTLRDQIVLQSKCGIRFPEGNTPARYDFSKEHIIDSVNKILERLSTDYLDILLLHRPDPLMDPDEVAEAFESLKKSGKVKHFGVSNMNAPQMQLLQQAWSDPLVVNQIEMSLAHLDWLEHTVLFNQEAGRDVNFASGTLEYCRMNDVQIQAWGSLANGIFSGRSIEGASETVQRTAALVKQLANEKETSAEAIVLGWLMKHPAMIQPVIGTANVERIYACKDSIRQSELLTRDEWYALYVTARGNKMP